MSRSSGPRRVGSARLAAIVGRVFVASVALIASERRALADVDPAFAQAVRALAEERTDDAIAQFEALADRGVLDAAASFDRGLAYAHRIREGRDEPGDLGRAAHGFEEARALTEDPALAADATRALTAVRGEVARRRARAGDADDVDEGTSLAGAVADVLPEDGWALLAFAGGLALVGAAAARVASNASQRRRRAAEALVALFGTLALAVGAALGAVAREERTTTRPAIVVAPQASLADDRFVSLPGRRALAEGARVRVLEERDTHVRVRLLDAEGWLPRAAVRVVSTR